MEFQPVRQTTGDIPFTFSNLSVECSLLEVEPCHVPLESMASKKEGMSCLMYLNSLIHSTDVYVPGITLAIGDPVLIK